MALRPTLIKEISSVQNVKEAFWETALPCVNAAHSYTFLFSDQCVNTIYWKSAIRYFIAQWTLGWQRKYPQMQTRKKLSRYSLVICEFISQSNTYVSWSSLLTLSLRNLRCASLDGIEAYAVKGNFIRSKSERSFLRNFFLICDFISQSYNLDFRKQFASTL